MHSGQWLRTWYIFSLHYVCSEIILTWIWILFFYTVVAIRMIYGIRFSLYHLKWKMQCFLCRAFDCSRLHEGGVDKSTLRILFSWQGYVREPWRLHYLTRDMSDVWWSKKRLKFFINIVVSHIFSLFCLLTCCSQFYCSYPFIDLK